MELKRSLPCDDAYIECGRLGAPHALRGEINFFYGDAFESFFVPGDFVFLKIDELYVPFQIETIRQRSADTVLVKFVAIESAESLEKLRGVCVAINPSDYAGRLDDVDALADDDDPADNCFYAESLIGFEVVDKSGNVLGMVTDYEDSTLNSLLIVEKKSGGEFYIPFVDEYIDTIDDESKRLSIVVPDGFEDLM